MVKFNELKITPDNEYLIIDVSVDNAEYYDGVFIDSIIIDNQDTYVENGPSSNPIFTYNVNKEAYNLVYSLPESCSCSPVQDEESKNYCFSADEDAGKYVRLVIKSEDLRVPIAGSLFVVYVNTIGEPREDTPCSLRQSTVTGTAVNLYPIYKSSLGYFKELGDTCNIPKGLIDTILRINAIELAIRTGNYTRATKYWKKFFSNIRYINTSSNCGCYGASY